MKSMHRRGNAIYLSRCDVNHVRAGDACTYTCCTRVEVYADTHTHLPMHAGLNQSV